MESHTHPMDENQTFSRECMRPAPFSSTEFHPVLLAHCYVLGTMFNLLAVSAVFFLYRLLSMKARPLVLYVNVLLIILSIMRYIYLTFDPYNINMYFPQWVVQLLEDLAIPCLTSAFAIIQYALFQLCKVQRPNKHMQSPRILSGIVACHFIFVIVIDVLVIADIAGCWLLMLCHVLTLSWGLLLCVTVSMVAFTLVRRDKRIKRTLRGDSNPENGHQPPSSRTQNEMQVDDPAKKKKFRDHLRKLKRICFSASLTGLICFIVSLIGMILINSPAVDYQVGEVGWLLYQTAQRLVEIAFGFILLYISWQRSDGNTT